MSNIKQIRCFRCVFCLAGVLLVLGFSLLFFGCNISAEIQQTTGETSTEADLNGDVMINVEQVQRELVAGYGLNIAVLYNGQDGDRSWENTMDYLETSLLLGVEAEAVEIHEEYSLENYDVVIPDMTILSSGRIEFFVKELVAYTDAGGYVLLDNAFSPYMPCDYLGISEVVKWNECPVRLVLPELSQDLSPIQEVVKDYAMLYPEFVDAEDLLGRDYGYGFVVDSATTIATFDEHAVYIYNEYGKGGVLVTNPLLPNAYSLGAYTMTKREGEASYAATTASCNQLLYSRFAGYVAKTRYGYALNRVYGYYGSPSMAWELHYEEITGFINGSLFLFDNLCKDYLQIPSYTLIRNSYWWFLKAESVTYLLNQGQTENIFQMDYEENAYSSGTHVVSGNEWLSLNTMNDTGSYFVDYPEQNYRAYPCFGDVDGDGKDELVCGSVDGSFYLYDNLMFSDRFHASEAQQLSNTRGKALNQKSFSAPQLIDMDGDGLVDLVSGDAKGRISWYKNLGDTFSARQKIVRIKNSGQALPCFGDMDGDGVTDLIVGTDQGILRVYYGIPSQGKLRFNTKEFTEYMSTDFSPDIGHWMAPSCVDWDGDGDQDLAVGTLDGYIIILRNDGRGQLSFGNYVDVNEMNYKGNYHAKFGNYCVPVCYDLNGDQRLDLVCGSFEYGMAYPIDSPYFPYRQQLQAQVDHVIANDQYIGLHHYTCEYASPEREEYELRRHLEVLRSYGIDTDMIGVNAHTWHMSYLGDTQTLEGEYKAGLHWNSGFESPASPNMVPQIAAENVIALPFFLQVNGEDNILVQNNSVFPYKGDDWTNLSAKYEMPLCIYYHCDMMYRDDAEARRFVENAYQFQWSKGYNFVREDQMMKASAAVINLDIETRLENGDLYIKGLSISKDGHLYNEKTQTAIGICIEFAEGIEADSYHTDAHVWYRKANRLYVGLDKEIVVTTDDRVQSSRLVRVNSPAEINVSETGATVQFHENGMLQVVVRGEAQTSTEGWTVTVEDGNTVFTKYGKADRLEIIYRE